MRWGGTCADAVAGRRRAGAEEKLRKDLEKRQKEMSKLGALDKKMKREITGMQKQMQRCVPAHWRGHAARVSRRGGTRMRGSMEREMEKFSDVEGVRDAAARLDEVRCGLGGGEQRFGELNTCLRLQELHILNEEYVKRTDSMRAQLAPLSSGHEALKRRVESSKEAREMERLLSKLRMHTQQTHTMMECACGEVGNRGGGKG